MKRLPQTATKEAPQGAEAEENRQARWSWKVSTATNYAARTNTNQTCVRRPSVLTAKNRPRARQELSPSRNTRTNAKMESPASTPNREYMRMFCAWRIASALDA